MTSTPQSCIESVLTDQLDSLQAQSSCEIVFSSTDSRAGYIVLRWEGGNVGFGMDDPCYPLAQAPAAWIDMLASYGWQVEDNLREQHEHPFGTENRITYKLTK